MHRHRNPEYQPLPQPRFLNVHFPFIVMPPQRRRNRAEIQRCTGQQSPATPRATLPAPRFQINEVGVYIHELEPWLPVQVLQTWNTARPSENKAEAFQIRPDVCPGVRPTDPGWYPSQRSFLDEIRAHELFV